MPYIKSNDGRREALQRGESALNAGELNYQIFYYCKHEILQESIFPKDNLHKNMINRFVSQFLGNKPNYQRYNDMVGCLILCGKEIKRRLNIDLEEYFKEIINSYDKSIAKYENTKIISNGDVE